MIFSRRAVAVATAIAIYSPMSAYATNGMNLEGYGPIATGMGGASMAYDNGTAAMMNNPATLGLMESGSSRLDVALGVLGPDVTAEAPAAMGGAKADSDGDSYLMPAIGYAKKYDRLTYGVGVFAQGGMGTEYDEDTWLTVGPTGQPTGQDARSELGVGRFMVPLTFDVNDKLTVGGSIDYVWGGLDLEMVMPVFNAMGGATAGTFADFSTAFGGSEVLGTATFDASLQAALGGAVGMGYDTVGFNFSNGNDFTQEAKGDGFGGKFGLVYKINPQWTVGGVYQFETSMSDWEGDAELVLYDTDGANPDGTLTGSVTVKDFQWPAMAAVGASFQPNDRLMLAADVKVIYWSDVMEDFTMVFEADANAGFGVTGGDEAEITFFQEWDDQTVVSLGGSYRVTDAFTVRAGANISDNPIPDEYVHPLFPAIIEEHYTIGAGYAFSDVNAVNFSLAYAPEVTVTNENTGVEISHSQTNWQLMYSHKF